MSLARWIDGPAMDAKAQEMRGRAKHQNRKHQAWLESFNANNEWMLDHPRNLVTDEWEAETHCGHCGCYAGHPTRMARTDAPTVITPGEIEEMRGYGGNILRRVDTTVWSHQDETMYSVMRTCGWCGNEWGQVTTTQRSARDAVERTPDAEFNIPRKWLMSPDGSMWVTPARQP